MKSWNLSNGYKIYKVLTGRFNSYLISTPNGNFLVDTGMKHNRNKLIKNIKSVISPNSKIDFLILTHTHFDHCQNASILKEIFSFKIILGKSEGEFVKQGYTTLPKGTNIFTKVLCKIGNKIGFQLFGYDAFIPDNEVNEYLNLKDNEFDIEILSTPGHSSGSISIIVNKEIALVGDTMFGFFKNSVFPPFADDQNELFRSWKILFDTGCNLFLPGHGGEIKRELVKNELNKRLK